MQSPKKHTNRLASETSPYLLQHAHNPVDWFPWGDDAFAKAKEEDKPVLLSIGYSACHWCHVMEHESFEDERIAAIMNERFVNIKVDMEERPDVDKIYMNFVQMTTGSGGWPMTVFLTHDQRPFFGGTYFPPVPRFNLPSFEQILISVAEAYENNREEVLRSANDILGEIRRIGIVESSPLPFGEDLLAHAFKSFERSFDLRNGGFGGAPKFPSPMALDFLLRYHKRTGDEKALAMVTQTCQKMAHGGIFDQLGGGFHRYTVDSNWLTPHFEKMLYDNAQLAKLYVHVFQVTKDPFFERISRETLDYVLREMTDASGGFYSSEDADSEGVEGKFFIWELSEVETVLGKEDAEVFTRYYDISKDGNFEERNILNVKRSFAEVRSELGLEEGELEEILTRGKDKLLARRAERVRPHRDEKVLAAWNGLMLAAFAEAGAAFGERRYVDAAEANAKFISNEIFASGRLLRTWKNGEAKLNAYLEDYANVADGLIRLYQVTGKFEYLSTAEALVGTILEKFWDDEAGGFYFTSDDHEDLIVRSKDLNDNATPSGNSAAADVLLRLSKLLSNDEYERFGLATLRLYGSQIERYPGAFGRALSVMEFALGPVKEIVVTGERAEDLESVLAGEYLPLKVILRSGVGSDDLPLMEGRSKTDGGPTIYVCENRTCKLPVSDEEGLREQLGI